MQGPITITLATCLDTCYWPLAGKWPVNIWPVSVVTIVGQSFSSKCPVAGNNYTGQILDTGQMTGHLSKICPMQFSMGQILYLEIGWAELDEIWYK